MEKLQSPKTSDILILTAAINPGTGVNARMCDTQERLFQYLCSLVSWIQHSSISSIIFCENTNYDYNYDPIINMAVSYSKNLEVLPFQGNEKSYKYGKGWGEGRILDYVYEHSKLLHEHSCFYKITGQYFMKNFDEFTNFHKDYSNIFVLQKINSKYSDKLFNYTSIGGVKDFLNITYDSSKRYFFYLKRGQLLGRKNVDYRVVTFLYKSNVDFFKNNLLQSYHKVYDRYRYVIEKVYCDDLKDQEFLQEFLLQPKLIGRSGTGGTLIHGLDYDNSIKDIAKSLM